MGRQSQFNKHAIEVTLLILLLMQKLLELKTDKSAKTATSAAVHLNPS
jgi:hypothetical protein